MVDIAQLANYLHATGHRIGLLLGFGSTSLVFRRVVDGYEVSARHELDSEGESVELPSAGKAELASVQSVAPTLPPPH